MLWFRPRKAKLTAQFTLWTVSSTCKISFFAEGNIPHAEVTSVYEVRSSKALTRAFIGVHTRAHTWTHTHVSTHM